MNLPLVEDRSSWDIFFQAPDELRAMGLLASRLAETPTRRVRVFVENPASLRVLSSRIDDALWIQPLGNYELWRTRLAEVVAPADNVVRLNGARISPRYLERTAYGAKERRKILNVWPLGHVSTSGEFSVVQGAAGMVQVDMVQTTSRDGGGLIKAPRGTAEMRMRWRGKGNLTMATMDLLGLRDCWSADSMVVFVSGVTLSGAEQVARALEQACGRPQLLLVCPPVSVEQAGQSDELIAFRCANGQVTSRSVSRVSWGQFDELVWCSDLVFACHRDIAQRAMEAGTPLVWLGRDEGLLDWYLQDASMDFRRCAHRAVRQFNATPSNAAGLVWFSTQQDVLLAMAASVEQKMSRAASLQDSIAEIDVLLEDWFKQVIRERAAMSNAPTSPMGLHR